jgi:threonine synthase
LLKAKAAGRLPKDQKIVITVTGNGLKDVQWALEGSADPIVIPVSLTEAAKVLELS